MNRMQYDFKLEDAIRFATTQGARTKNFGDELQFEYCPYCHGGRNRDKWTFSISKKNGAFNCMRSSCGVKGNMITLAEQFGLELDKDISAYYNLNNYNNKFKKFKDAHREIEVRSPAIEYLKSRGISEHITRKYEITTAPDEPNKLIFPFRDENGDTTFIKYRNTNYVKGESYGSKEWCEPNCRPILFGMYQCDLENKTLIITEGQLDSLSVAEAGYKNAVSVPMGMNGFTWVPQCWNWIVNNFDTIIVFGDCENNHITLLDEIYKRFGAIKVVKHVRITDYCGEKDANDILKKYGTEQIQHCVENAEKIPIRHLVDLADVKPINIYEIEKLPTGFTQLDKMLYGGLPFGNVTLVTGKRGEGKSTFASQLLASALLNDYKCYVYTGELDNAVFKSWLDYQIAGDDNLIEYQDNLYSEKKYKLSDEDQEKISSWYKGKCNIQEDWFHDMEDEEYESLCKLVEQSAIQDNTRVVLLDNLMTAMDEEPLSAFDKYDQQSKFVKKLARIARRLNLAIILVSHKRKNDSSDAVDDISGSADIGNLAAVILDYQRGSKNDAIDENQRKLKVLKNRFFGTLNTSGWVMDYSPKSKRIYDHETKAELNKTYGWSELEGFSVVEDDEIPF